MSALVPTGYTPSPDPAEETKQQRTERLLREAGAELYRLHQVIRAAQEAGMRPMPVAFHETEVPTPMSFERWVVDKDDWERLQAMKKIIMAERC